jgi:hypothetical protein
MSLLLVFLSSAGNKVLTNTVSCQKHWNKMVVVDIFFQFTLLMFNLAMNVTYKYKQQPVEQYSCIVFFYHKLLDQLKLNLAEMLLWFCWSSIFYIIFVLFGNARWLPFSSLCWCSILQWMLHTNINSSLWNNIPASISIRCWIVDAQDLRDGNRFKISANQKAWMEAILHFRITQKLYKICYIDIPDITLIIYLFCLTDGRSSYRGYSTLK